MFRTLKHPGAMVVTMAAAGILMITMGIRQSIGLYLSPINTTTGLGIVTLSLALAIGVMSAAGTGAASFSVLIGAAAQKMPA